MSTPILTAAELDCIAAIQHADDLQRDRALRRPAAAPRLFAPHDPLPASQPGPDRRLCGDFANAGLASPS